MIHYLCNQKGVILKYLVTLLLAAVVSSSAFSQSEVKIGNQIWMSKNLDVSTFRNGEAIPEAKSKEEWSKAGENKTAAFCYYEYRSNNGKVYGKLYNWYAVNDSRGLAPKGYHIPSDEEWIIVTDFLGGSDIAGKKMKSKNGWKSIEEGGKKTCPDCVDWTDSYKEQVPCHTCKNSRYIKAPIVTLNGNGDNSCGFNALPGSGCNYDGSFDGITEASYFWSSSEDDTSNSWNRNLLGSNTKVRRNSNDKNNGLSVRCVKD